MRGLHLLELRIWARADPPFLCHTHSVRVSSTCLRRPMATGSFRWT